MENHVEGMEKLLAIEKTISGMIELRSLVVELKELESRQQRTIEELRSDINNYKTYLENIPLSLFIKNMDLSYIYCNRNFSNDLKKEPEEIIGRTDRDLFPSDLAEKFLRDDRKILQSGEPEFIMEKFIDGEQKVIVQMVKSPLRDKNGEVIGLVGQFWDITKEKEIEEEATRYRAHIEDLLSSRTEALEATSQQLQLESANRKQVEERLRQTEGIHRTIFEGTGVALAVLNEEDTIILQANRNLEEILGIPREQLENTKRLSEFVAEGDLEKIMEHFQSFGWGKEALSGGREYRFVDQQGKVKEIFVTLALIPDTGRIGASFLDVSDRNSLRKDLQRSEERFRELFEKASVAISVIQKGLIKFVNPKIMEIFGYSQEEFVSKPLSEFLYADDREIDKLLLNESDNEELPPVLFFRIIHQDGSIHWVEDRVNLIHWEGSPATINFFTDITLRKQAEDELLSSIQPLRDLIVKAEKVMTIEKGSGPLEVYL